MGDRRKPILVEVQRRITKFYVSNIPERCSGKDPAGVLRAHGIIFDIYIARKRGKGGNRFGFVLFLDVKNSREMELRSANIRLGEYKLCINVAKFVPEDGEIKKADSERRTMNKGYSKHGRVPLQKGYERRERVSFKDVLAGSQSIDICGKDVKIDDSTVAYEEYYGRALVVQMGSFEALRNVNQLLKEMKLPSGTIRYMGGLLVFMPFRNNDQAIMARDEIVGRKKEFAAVDIWEGQDEPFERLAWLKIQGLPLSILKNDVIDKVAERFGRIVQHAQHEWDDADVSYHYVAIMVNNGDGYKMKYWCIGVARNISYG